MLLCPECQSPLMNMEGSSRGSWRCGTCGHMYRKNEGIIQFSKNVAREERYFPAHAFDLLYQSEERNFWFRVRNKIIGSVVSQYLSPQARILEVGCGTGFVSRYLKRRGFHRECADLFFDALQFCKKRDAGYANYQYNLADRIFVNEFDAVCAFDVLEHIDDDCLIIRNMYDAMGGGWNSHDYCAGR